MKQTFLEPLEYSSYRAWLGKLVLKACYSTKDVQRPVLAHEELTAHKNATFNMIAPSKGNSGREWGFARTEAEDREILAE